METKKLSQLTIEDLESIGFVSGYKDRPSIYVIDGKISDKNAKYDELISFLYYPHESLFPHPYSLNYEKWGYRKQPYAVSKNDDFDIIDCETICFADTPNATIEEFIDAMKKKGASEKIIEIAEKISNYLVV